MPTFLNKNGLIKAKMVQIDNSYMHVTLEEGNASKQQFLRGCIRDTKPSLS
jgi:hypothetical protein